MQLNRQTFHFEELRFVIKPQFASARSGASVQIYPLRQQAQPGTNAECRIVGVQFAQTIDRPDNLFDKLMQFIEISASFDMLGIGLK